jgi:hypothetical protein
MPRAQVGAVIQYFVVIVEESNVVPKFWHRFQAFSISDDGETLAL